MISMDDHLILIVDDQPDFLEIFSTKLKAAGYRVETASNGSDALVKAKELKPDLVLLDVEMPEMNGAEVLQSLRDDPATKDTRVLFLTNLGHPGEETKAMNERISKEIGASGYLKKTDDLDNILMKIRMALAQHLAGT